MNDELLSLPTDAALSPDDQAAKLAADAMRRAQQPTPTDPNEVAAQQAAAAMRLPAMSAQAIAVGNSTQSAVAAGQAAPIARQLGVPQSAVETDIPTYQAQALAQKNASLIASNPVLAQWVAANPDSARVAQDEFDKLSLLERTWTAIRSGADTAALTNRLGRAGQVKQLAAAAGQEAPEADQRIAALQAGIQAAPQLRGPMGVLQHFSGFAAAMIDNALMGGAPGMAIGAAAGAAAGAPAMGVGAGPGAGLGAALGFGVGFRADMANVAAGNQYLKMNAMRGTDGQAMSEGAKQYGTLFTWAATYALGGQLPFMGKSAESVVQAAVQKAVTMPTFQRAMKTWAVDTGTASVRGAAVMTAMEASMIIGEEIAKIASPGQFTSDPHEMGERLTRAAVDGAVLIGSLHSMKSGLNLYGDIRSAQRAEVQANMLKGLLDTVSDSASRKNDPTGFVDFMRRQTDGEPAENLYIPAERVMELYQGARLDPATLTDRTRDPLFGFVADMPRQLEEARATGGDVVIPTADFVAHLAGTPVAEHLLPDIRVGADAMSVKEGAAFTKEYQERVKAATEAAAAERAEPPERESAERITAEAQRQLSKDRVAAEVRRQLLATGRIGEMQATRMAAVAAARYETRAERFGTDPYEEYLTAARGRGFQFQADEGPGAPGTEISPERLQQERARAEAEAKAAVPAKDEHAERQRELVDARKQLVVLQKLKECLA